MRSRFFFRSVAAAAALCCACTVVLRETEIASRLAEVSGTCVTLDEPLFGFKVEQTGVWRHCRFQKTIGFGIFESVVHRSGRLRVLLMHGHADGPDSLEALAASLDGEKFEPVFAFYPTGQTLEVTVKSMKESMEAYARERGVEEIAVVAYSMSGIVARRYLGEHAGREGQPRPVAFVTLSTPWGGSERGARWAWSPTAPPSWKDMAPGSDFLRHLFDFPLPEGMPFHVLYGTGGEDKRTIPGDDDGVISMKSAARKEALREADSVTVYPECGHKDMVRNAGPLEKVSELLEDAWDEQP